MTVIKTKSDSMEDESFDSFKRRRIERAKIQTSSASMQLPKDCEQGSRVSFSPILHKRNSRATSSARARWETQLKATFTSEHTNEHGTRENRPSASHRQLSLESSMGIKSPVHQGIDAELEKQKMVMLEKHGSRESKSVPCKKFKTPISERDSKCSNKLCRKLRDLHERQFLKELLETAGKLPLCSSRANPKHARGSHSSKHQGLDQWSRKKCKETVPLSRLLISPKEYFNLSVLPPVALEREERYNWGHIKKNQFSTNFIRHQIRVLQMSSQAPIPSAQALKNSAKTQKRLQSPQNHSKLSRKVKQNRHLRSTQGILASENIKKSSSYTKNSKRGRMPSDSQHSQSVARTYRPQVSHFFEVPRGGHANSLLKNKCSDEDEKHLLTSISHPSVEEHAQTVNDLDNRAPGRAQGIPKDNDTLQQATRSPMIVNASSLISNIEVSEPKEILPHLFLNFELNRGHQDSLDKRAESHMPENSRCHSKAQDSPQKSFAVDSHRISSQSPQSLAYHEENFALDQPLKIKSKQYPPFDSHPMVNFEGESNMKDGVGSEGFLHVCCPGPEDVFFSNKSVTLESKNIRSPNLSRNPQVGVESLSDEMKFFSPSLPPNQVMNERKDRNIEQDFALTVPKISVLRGSSMNGRNVLVPDTPSTSNQSKILSFEDSSKGASNTKETPWIGTKEGGGNKEGFCEVSRRPGSSNYSDESKRSMQSFVRQEKAPMVAISDNGSCENASMYETSESQGVGIQFFQEDAHYGPNPSQIRMNRAQKTIGRLGGKKGIQVEKIVAQNFHCQNIYHRKGFDFLPSYFSTKSPSFPFHKRY